MAAFLLSPVLVFAVGFLVGRRIDLPGEYGGVLKALVAGSAIGYGLGRVAAVLWTFGFDLGIGAVLGLVVPALVVAVARAVLAGFAGVALGYLLVSHRHEQASVRQAASDSAPELTRERPG